MTATALFLGAIGVLAETSELQRQAFNTAFEDHGVGWHWDRETYLTLLEVPGARARMRYFAMAQGSVVDVEALYQSKVVAFEQALSAGIDLRPGLQQMIETARTRGMKLGLVTTTDPRQVDAVLQSLNGQINRDTFDVVVDRTCVAHGKPAPDAYRYALDRLGVAPGSAVAIEDTPESAAAAVAAGIRTLAYPGVAAEGRDFGAAVAHIITPDAAVFHHETRAA
ncbi:MAG: HAD-IA family hydrolase [Pseudomonadota bacterium]